MEGEKKYQQMSLREEALAYHAEPMPGKVAVVATKPCETARDLALAYSPGVAEPCLAIAKNRDDVYRYTSKGNLVAVISNGTAVLGLGDIGPEAAKPVMEGKGVLFKWCANIDVFDLELNAPTVDGFIQTVEALAPTFGGVNLEDVKAPECFIIEEELQRQLDIPVFHDDQHGTAIIASAGLFNALEVVGKQIADVRCVINGAGAAGIACARLLVRLGMPRENILLCDTNGVIYAGRQEGMNPFKEEFASKHTARTLADAVTGADVFFGLSKAGALSAEMLRSMAENPIVFAMANPDPEIEPALAREVRSDVILATGRVDYPNQVNNVLCFPFIFRGALDVRASQINDEMKLAAVKALAALAKEPVPESVQRAYGNRYFSFGRDYLLPKPFDPRVLYSVAPAVAEAAMRTGVARKPIDIEEYTLRLKEKQNHGRSVLRGYYAIARQTPRKKIAFAEGENPKVVKAAVMAKDEGIAEPILFGRLAQVTDEIIRADRDPEQFTIVDPSVHPDLSAYTRQLAAIQAKRGMNPSEAQRAIRQEQILASVMLAAGDVDGLICGVDRDYPAVVRPILEIVGMSAGLKHAAGLYIVSIGGQVLFFTDTTINIEMTTERLAEIGVMAADFATSMSITPRLAFLSYSNFGSVRHPSAELVRNASELVRQRRPELEVDGEMQADVATVTSILRENYPFSKLKGAANVLVFPDMQSGNISYKLLQRLGGARVIGPILLGVRRPAYAMQRHASVDEIFNMVTVAVARAAIMSES